MNYKGHLTTGLVIGFIYIVIMHFTLGVYAFSSLNILTYIAIITLFSLLPDADHQSSKITWWLLGFGILGAWIGYWRHDNPVILYSLIVLAVTYIISRFTKHRGFTHTIWFPIIAAVLITYFSNIQFGSLAFVSTISHYIADQHNPFKKPW